MTADLLPPSATPQERALSLAAARAASPDADGMRRIWNPDTCPVALLPWLAWSLGVEPWETAWADDQKRDAIRAAFEVRRRRGTVGAIRRAVDALGYGRVIVVEGIEGPYTFGLRMDATAAGLTEAKLREIEAVAERAKNARSHLRSLVAVSESAAGSRLCAASVCADIITVRPA